MPQCNNPAVRQVCPTRCFGYTNPRPAINLQTKFRSLILLTRIATACIMQSRAQGCCSCWGCPLLCLPGLKRCCKADTPRVSKGAAPWRLVAASCCTSRSLDGNPAFCPTAACAGLLQLVLLTSASVLWRRAACRQQRTAWRRRRCWCSCCSASATASITSCTVLSAPQPPSPGLC
jgi:hypothetical protein